MTIVVATAAALSAVPVAVCWEGDEMPLTPALRSEYDKLFEECIVRDARRDEAEAIITRMLRDRGRYERVAEATQVPWHVIALIHNMECSGRFDCHLHNGDPLTRRTKHVPAGLSGGSAAGVWVRP